MDSGFFAQWRSIPAHITITVLITRHTCFGPGFVVDRKSLQCSGLLQLFAGWGNSI